jgi:hypothetical protein
VDGQSRQRLIFRAELVSIARGRSREPPNKTSQGLPITYAVIRFVILNRRLAYKLLSPRCGKPFPLRILANMPEVMFGRTGWPEFCPVLWWIPGGFFVVMPRVEVCTAETAPADYEPLTDGLDHVVPAEHKPSSWGYLDGRLVAIDYGS